MTRSKSQTHALFIKLLSHQIIFGWSTGAKQYCILLLLITNCPIVGNLFIPLFIIGGMVINISTLYHYNLFSDLVSLLVLLQPFTEFVVYFSTRFVCNRLYLQPHGFFDTVRNYHRTPFIHKKSLQNHQITRDFCCK